MQKLEKELLKDKEKAKKLSDKSYDLGIYASRARQTSMTAKLETAYERLKIKEKMIEILKNEIEKI